MFENLQHDILSDIAEAQTPASDSFLAELALDVRRDKWMTYQRDWVKEKREKRDTMGPVMQRCMLAECKVLIEQKENGRPRLFCCDAHKLKFNRNKPVLN